MGCLVSKFHANERAGRYKVTMEITHCIEQSPSDRYTILSKTWSTDQLIDVPTTRDGGGDTSFKEGRAEVDDANQADFSTMSVLSFLAAGTDEEHAGNISDAKTEFTDEKSPIGEIPGKLSEPRRHWVSLGNLVLDGEWAAGKHTDGEDLTVVSED